MSAHRRAAVAVILAGMLAATLTGCQNGRVGRRCSGTGFGQDATNVLQCKGGRWRVVMTKAQYVQLLIAIRNNTTTTTTTPATTAPTTTSAPAPAPAPAPTTTTTTTTTTPPAATSYAIAAGYEHTCAVIAGAVKCVGSNTAGKLGNGTTTDSLTWVNTGITDGFSTASGSASSCALRGTGTVWCWGFGVNGLLGDGNNTNSSTPVQVSGITNASQLSVGANGACVRTQVGQAKCWGSAQYRGDGAGGVALTPVTASISDVTKMAVGTTFACALKSDGTVWCWGDGAQGQLGNGGTADATSPVQVTGISTAIDVSAGGLNGGAACAVLADRTVRCWGNDEFGQIGDGNGATTDYSSPAPPVVGVTDATRVTIGFRNACVVRSGGGVKCWGSEALGNGSATPSTSAVDVTGINNAVTVNAQAETTCALLSTSGAKCWGRNGFGEAGSGNTNSALSPLTVVGMP